MAEVSFSGYGKNEVRLMRVRKDGDKYDVAELKVNIELQLSTSLDYEKGDNRDVVATDSQKNTILVLARQNPIQSPEQFGILLCRHFLSLYSQVVRVKVYLEQAPWQRIKVGGAEHNHAFILEPSVLRFSTVSQMKGGVVSVSGGLKNMKILKTTKSGFEGFVRDSFTTLPETSDRTFCTNVYLSYDLAPVTHSQQQQVNYNGIWEMARSAVLDVFAGPPQTGTYSPSIQKTMCDTAALIFARVAEVTSVDIDMPNIHYFTADLRKLNIPMSGELLLPSDSPRGKIAATFTRKQNSKL